MERAERFAARLVQAGFDPAVDGDRVAEEQGAVAVYVTEQGFEVIVRDHDPLLGPGANIVASNTYTTEAEAFRVATDILRARIGGAR